MLDRPNVLVVLTRGLRADAHGSSGVWPIKTPHLDGLTRDGMGVVAVTASPADLPGLLSLYTGLHPRQHGVLDDLEEVIPAVDGWVGRFREAGYYTVGVGRVQPIQETLDEAWPVADVGRDDDPDCVFLEYTRSAGFYQEVRRKRRQRQRTGPLELSGQGVNDPGHDVDGFIAARAAALVGRMPQGRPWLMVVSFTGPGNHMPAPAPYLSMVGKMGPERIYVPHDLGRVDDYADLNYPRARLARLTPHQAAEIQREYLGRVCLIDHAVEMLRSALARHEHGERTWFLLSSNHGQLLGERGVFGHRSFLKDAAYVPLWIVPPEGMRDQDQEQQAIDGLISSVDLAATLCAIGQVDPVDGAWGESLLPALFGYRMGREACLSEFGHRLMLETMRHKVGFNIERIEPRFLFDLYHDPRERRDLLGNWEAENTLEMLRWQLSDLLMPMQPVRLYGSI